jgi:hypothetical protein
MAYVVNLNVSKKARPFAFAVSNRAVYIPRIKLIAKTDPYYFQRVPISQIQRVTIRRLPPYALWALAAVMIPVGLWTTFVMMQPILMKVPGTHHVSGWPISLFVCGFLVPFVARGRYGMEIAFSGGRYRWKPPLVVDKASKQKIAALIEACRKVGVLVSDGRRS